MLRTHNKAKFMLELLRLINSDSPGIKLAINSNISFRN